jgi:hypothetical protein
VEVGGEGGAAAVATAVGVAPEGAASIRWPQPLQKALSGGLEREQAGQIAARRTPQPLQKAASSGFSR